MSDLPTAYCAPGRREVSALILALKDEQAADIIESQFVTGADVILVQPQAFGPLNVEFKLEPCPRSRLEALARLNHWPVPPSPMVLSAVI